MINAVASFRKAVSLLDVSSAAERETHNYAGVSGFHNIEGEILGLDIFSGIYAVIELTSSGFEEYESRAVIVEVILDLHSERLCSFGGESD